MIFGCLWLEPCREETLEVVRSQNTRSKSQSSTCRHYSIRFRGTEYCTGSSNLNQQSSRRRASDTSRTALFDQIPLGYKISGVREVITSKAKEISKKLLG